MSSNERKILIFTSLSHFLTHFYILIFPALVMPMSRDLLLTPNKIINISFLMYLFYGLLAIPWGYISDRYNPRVIMGSGIIIAGLGMLLGFFNSSQNYLTASFAVVGIGCSAYHPSGLTLLTKGMRLRGSALGINGFLGNIGIASAPLAAGILTYLTDWKTTLLILGITGIITGFLSLMVPFSVERYEDMQKGTSVKKNSAVRMFIIICITMFFSGLMYRGITVILPAFFEFHLTDLHGFSSSLSERIIVLTQSSDSKTLMATSITGAVFIIGMIGQLIGGKVSDTCELRRSYLLFFVTAFPFLLLLYFLTGPWLVVSAGIFFLFALGMQPIENSLVAMLTPPQWRSISYGIKFTVVFGAGSLAVKIVSFVEGNYGINMVIPVLSFLLFMVISSISVLILLSRGTSIKHHR